MSTPFLYPFSPTRLEARQPRIIEDLLEVAFTRDGPVITAMIEMLTDLHKFGRDSRYVRKLKGLPLSELKTQARGGQKGGARIYFAFTANGEALLMNAEVKADDSPSEAKIREGLEILLAFRQGRPLGL